MQRIEDCSDGYAMLPRARRVLFKVVAAGDEGEKPSQNVALIFQFPVHLEPGV